MQGNGSKRIQVYTLHYLGYSIQIFLSEKLKSSCIDPLKKNKSKIVSL
jgi:hypothetical protein